MGELKVLLCLNRSIKNNFYNGVSVVFFCINLKMFFVYIRVFIDNIWILCLTTTYFYNAYTDYTLGSHSMGMQRLSLLLK